MGRKFLATVLLAVLGVSLILSPKMTRADSSSYPTIEDAVYADLALRHYLTNISISSFGAHGEDSISINTDKQWVPASTVKTYVAMYAFKKIQDNELSLDDFILIDPDNVVPTEMETDEMPALNEGQSVTVNRLIRQMLTQSDNTAYNTLLDVLDREEITKYAKSLGFSHTTIGSKLNLDSNQQQSELNAPGYGINRTSADDYSSAFDLIRRGKVPGARELYLILKDQKINNMIPLLLPKNVTVAHKTGDLDPLYHDGGIIVGPNRTYVLSMFSNLGDPNILAHISQLVYTKDYSLVGVDVQNSTSSENINQPIDPLVLNPNSSQQFLGAKDVSAVQIPSINAADLGIKPSDLSLDLGKQELPNVLIPADSPVHFLVTISQTIRGIFVPKIKNQLDNMNLKLAEASDLESRSKNQMAGEILQKVQSQLVTTVKDKKIEDDQNAQTAAQAISETRFTLLGQTLKSQDSTQRNETIKTIAKAARETLSQVQPNIPDAVSATSLSQKPLIGNVTNVSDSKITIKSPSGLDITVPITKDMRIREKGKPKVAVAAPSIDVGTTVALIGSPQGNDFKASFILTNLPKQLVATQPAVVLKVNKNTNTIVVAENGVPIQVDVTNQTVIKGSGTNVSLGAIKQNDVVVVRGENIVASPATPKSSTISGNLASPSPAPSSFSPTSPSLPPSNALVSPQPSAGGKPSSPNPNLNPKPSPTGQGQLKNETQTVQPKVIRGTTIQIIEKHGDTPKKPSTSENSGKSQKPSSNPAPKKDIKSQKSGIRLLELVLERLLGLS